jgi:hypothetical protein
LYFLHLGKTKVRLAALLQAVPLEELQALGPQAAQLGVLQRQALPLAELPQVRWLPVWWLRRRWLRQ